MDGTSFKVNTLEMFLPVLSLFGTAVRRFVIEYIVRCLDSKGEYPISFHFLHVPIVDKLVLGVAHPVASPLC